MPEQHLDLIQFQKVEMAEGVGRQGLAKILQTLPQYYVQLHKLPWTPHKFLYSNNVHVVVSCELPEYSKQYNAQLYAKKKKKACLNFKDRHFCSMSSSCLTRPNLRLAQFLKLVFFWNLRIWKLLSKKVYTFTSQTLQGLYSQVLISGWSHAELGNVEHYLIMRVGEERVKWQQHRVDGVEQS